MAGQVAENILAPFVKLKKRLPLNSWEIPAAIAVCVMILLQFLRGAGVISRYIFIAVPFCVCFMLLVMAGLPKERKAICFSGRMMFCWFGTAFFILLTSVFIEQNFLIEAALWAVGFPVFFAAWANRPVRDLANPIILGVYLSFAVFLVVSIVNFPLETTRYQSFFQNQNSLSLYCSAVYTVALCDAVAGKRRLLSAIVIGIAALMVISTASRGGLIAILVCTAAAAVMITVKEKRRHLRVLASVFVPIVLAITLSLLGGVQMLQAAHSVVELVSGREVSLDDLIFSDVTTEDLLLDQADRLEQGDGDINTITTGRADLWEAYLKEVGLLGHADTDTVCDESGQEINKSSHFTLIQMAYSYGAPAAVFFLLFNVMAGLRALRDAYRRKEEYALFPALIAVTYGVYYLVESLSSPVTVLLTMLYLMSQAAIITHAEAR